MKVKIGSNYQPYKFEYRTPMEYRALRPLPTEVELALQRRASGRRLNEAAAYVAYAVAMVLILGMAWL